MEGLYRQLLCIMLCGIFALIAEIGYTLCDVVDLLKVIADK